MCKYMLNLIFINKITLNYILLVIGKKKAVNVLYSLVYILKIYL